MENLDYHLKALKYHDIVHEAKKQYKLINYVFVIQYMANQEYFKHCHEAAYNFMMDQKFIDERFFVAMFDTSWRAQYGWVNTKQKLTESFNANLHSYFGGSGGHASVFSSLQSKLNENNDTLAGLNIVFILTNNHGGTFFSGAGSLKNIIEKPNNKLFIVDMTEQTYSAGHSLLKKQNRNSMYSSYKLLPEIHIYDISHANNIKPFFNEIINLQNINDAKDQEEIKFGQQKIEQEQMIKKLTIDKEKIFNQKQDFCNKTVINHEADIRKIINESEDLKKSFRNQILELKKKLDQTKELNNKLYLQKQILDQKYQFLQKAYSKESSESEKFKKATEEAKIQMSFFHKSQINMIKEQNNQSYQKQEEEFQKKITEEMIKQKQDAEEWKQKLNDLQNQSIKQIEAIKEFRQEVEVVMKHCLFYAYSAKIVLECKTTQFDHYLIKYSQKNGPTDLSEEAFTENTCIIRGLQPKTLYKFQVKVMLKNKKETFWQSNPQFCFMTNLPNEKQQFLSHSNIDEKKQFIDKAIKNIRQKFTFEFALPEVKIALFGSMSQGKSSAANTILSVLKQQYNFISIVGNANESVTKKMFRVKDILGTQVPLTLFDTFGIEFRTGQKNSTTVLDSTNYKDCLDHYLRGTLYDEYENNDSLDKEKLLKFEDGIDRLCHEMHAVIYVISYEFLNENAEGIKLANFILKEFRNRGIQPVIALTKCDELIGNSPLSEIQSHKKVEMVLKDMKEKLRIDQEDIFLVVNYRSRKEDRDYDKQFYILKMLEEAILRARQRIYYRLQQFFWIQKDDNTFYGAIEKIGLESLGNKLEPIMNRSFKALGLQFKNLMFLKYEYIFGQSKEVWIQAEQFKDTPIKYFIRQAQNKRILRIRDNSTNYQKKKQLLFKQNDYETFGLIELYDPVKKMKAGVLDLKKIPLEEAMKIRQISIEEEYKLVYKKEDVEVEAYGGLTVGEVMQGPFIETKIIMPVIENVPGSTPTFIVSLIDKSDEKTIDQFKMKYKCKLKNSQFLIQLRKKASDILEEYKVCKLKTERMFPDNQELAEDYLLIKQDQIVVYCMKK